MVKRRFGVALGMLCGLALVGCALLPQPPVASFLVHYDVDGEDPMVVELDASASSDPNGDAITTYMWTFGDDVTILTPLDVSKTVTVPELLVRYPVEGTYTVYLVVTNEQGEASPPFSATLTLPHE